MKYFYAITIAAMILVGCSQKEESAPLPTLKKVEIPEGIVGLYSGRLPCENCKVHYVKMTLAEDSSATIQETIITEETKMDTLQGTFSVTPEKVVVILPENKTWSFKVGFSGALELLTGAGTVYVDENGMKADLIRILSSVKKDSSKQGE